MTTTSDLKTPRKLILSAWQSKEAEREEEDEEEEEEEEEEKEEYRDRAIDNRTLPRPSFVQ